MTLTTNPRHPGWDVGAEVIGRFGYVLKIAKVHKSGNVVLEGGDRQWRPCGGDTAVLCGDRGWRHSCVHLATPERLAAAEEERQIAAARDKAIRLTKALNHCRDFRPHLSAIEALIAALAERGEG